MFPGVHVPSLAEGAISLERALLSQSPPKPTPLLHIYRHMTLKPPNYFIIYSFADTPIYNTPHKHCIVYFFFNRKIVKALPYISNILL